MKKITLTLLLFLFSMGISHSQVLIGEGTNTEQVVPINTYYGYTYSQSIYLSSEINATGTITSLQWYFSGSTALTNNQDIVIYFGQTDKTSFDSSSDFIPVDELTQVYSGGIVTNSTPGWKTITLNTPFVYDNISNLVIAVDENTPNYDNSADDFYNTSVSGQRSIYAFSDIVNFDPSDPNNDQNEFPSRGIVAFVPNIILGGIQQDCPNPSGIVVSNVTITDATATWTAAEGQTSWEVIIQETELGTPETTASGVAVTGTPTYTKTDLTDNTMYTAYVRAICSETEKSGWVASQSFNTLCLFFDDFEENFDSTPYGSIPNCWSSKKVSTNSFTYVQTVDYNSASPSNCIEMYNSGDAEAELLLISPGLTSIGSNTHRIKFKARSYGNSNTLILGTMTDPTDVSTFTTLNTYTLNDSYTDFNYTFNATTTDNFIAFKHGGGQTYVSIFIDDVVWEPIPTVAPECISDLNVTINEECGNFPSLFEWAAVDGADGYYLSIGTSENGGDLVVDNVNVYNALNYMFSGNPGTTYYFKVTPYNAFGSAMDCFEDNFTTYEDGCYCVSEPLSVDNSGITLVQINEAEFQNEPGEGDAVTYYDFTVDGATDILQGVITSLNITFEIGYTYNTNVWIDYNDNYTFEASELVYSGNSSNVNPTVLNASFLTALTANLGEHRMRIGATASTQTPPNPCFNQYGGVTLDFLINVLEAPTCLPPSNTNVTNITANTAQVNWTSEGTSFNVEYDYAPFLQGSGTVISGIEANMVTLSDLDSQQDYMYYIQNNCDTDGLSPWIGPFTFRTACDAFGDFEENFTTEESIVAPECWYTLKNATSQYSSIQIYSYNDYVEMYNSDDANAELYLITPNLTALPNGDHRAKFKAFSYSSDVSVIVGTMTDPAMGSTFTAVETIPLTDSFMEYAVSFNTTTADTHVAFKFVGNNSYQSVYIDDFVWEPIPTVAPVCVSDLNIATNTDCGNYPSTFTWSAVPGADFYNLTIGTTSGEGTTINLGNVTSYSFEGNYDTTYYYTLVPENAFGPAVGCVEGTFTTYSEGCYCESIPSSFDNSGITNVSINESEFANGEVSYTDFSSDEDIVIYQGQLTDVQVSFATGYTYNTYLFIDFNDNYVFEPTEQVFAGESTNENPTVYDASFTLADDATLGVHRMRLVTYDYTETPAMGNPCYSGTYGVTADFNVSVQDILSTGGFESNSFAAYPNPVKDMLTLSYTKNITNVEVFNLLGQQVLFLNMDANKGQVDMSHLPSGTYLVKVNSETGVKTIKVIKE